MKHWVIGDYDDIGPCAKRHARAGTSFGDELWRNGGWRTSVGRWAVLVTVDVPPSRVEKAGTWVHHYPRFTSRSRARAYAQRWADRPRFNAKVVRWRRGRERHFRMLIQGHTL